MLFRSDWNWIIYPQGLSEEFVKLIESNYFDNEVLSEYSEWGILDGKLGIALVALSLKFKRRIIGEEIFGINCRGEIS